MDVGIHTRLLRVSRYADKSKVATDINTDKWFTVMEKLVEGSTSYVTEYSKTFNMRDDPKD
jgi:hypothetical protein